MVIGGQSVTTCLAEMDNYNVAKIDHELTFAFSKTILGLVILCAFNGI